MVYLPWQSSLIPVQTDNWLARLYLISLFLSLGRLFPGGHSSAVSPQAIASHPFSQSWPYSSVNESTAPSVRQERGSPACEGVLATLPPLRDVEFQVHEVNSFTVPSRFDVGSNPKLVLHVGASKYDLFPKKISSQGSAATAHFDWKGR